MLLLWHTLCTSFSNSASCRNFKSLHFQIASLLEEHQSTISKAKKKNVWNEIDIGS